MTHEGEDVIPISLLFFDDAGPHIVQTTSSPREFGGTTLAARDATGVAAGTSTPSASPVKAGRRFTPARGRELQDLLGTSIAQLGGVSGRGRRTTPSPAVPIETLLYRGRHALDRALEIRAACRLTGQPPTGETIEELLDLIGLAAEE